MIFQKILSLKYQTCFFFLNKVHHNLKDCRFRNTFKLNTQFVTIVLFPSHHTYVLTHTDKLVSLAMAIEEIDLFTNTV